MSWEWKNLFRGATFNSRIFSSPASLNILRFVVPHPESGSHLQLERKKKRHAACSFREKTLSQCVKPQRKPLCSTTQSICQISPVVRMAVEVVMAKGKQRRFLQRGRNVHVNLGMRLWLSILGTYQPTWKLVLLPQKQKHGTLKLFKNAFCCVHRKAGRLFQRR